MSSQIVAIRLFYAMREACEFCVGCKCAKSIDGKPLFFNCEVKNCPLISADLREYIKMAVKKEVIF